MSSISTAPLLPPKATSLRLAAFSSAVYNVQEGSTLYSLVDALAGDGGVGSLKKQMLIARLAKSLDSTYFRDIDSAFGNITQLIRLASETYPYDPSSDLLTSAQWDEIAVKDSWYRSRIINFFTALGLGGTNDGLRMMVKAALSLDCDIYEVWRFQDYYAQMKGISNVSLITNIIPNPSFEGNTYGWTYVGGSSPTFTITSAFPDAVQSGSACLKFITGTTVTTPSVSSIQCKVSAGLPYTFSLYYYWPSANPLTSFVLTATHYNSAGSVISTATSPSFTAVTNNRTRASFASIIPPTNTVASVFSLKFNGTVTSTTSTVYLDAVQVTGGATAVPYFDGYMSGYMWTGPIAKSSSIEASPISALSRLTVPCRNEVIVRPNKSVLSPQEQREVRSMLKRIAPVDSVITVTTAGVPKATLLNNIIAQASSSYFVVQSFVTGTRNPVQSRPGYNSTWNWLQKDTEVEAPVGAFNEPQAYSESYPYSTNPTETLISSVTYTSQDTRDQIFPEQSFKQTDRRVSSWGPWIQFGKADSPDNYPGGKRGYTPHHAPALDKWGRVPYPFTYKSQEDYIDHIKGEIIAQSAGRWYPTAFMISRLPNGQHTPTAYRLPLSFADRVLKSWTPKMAVSSASQVNTYTVTTPIFNRGREVQVP